MFITEAYQAHINVVVQQFGAGGGVVHHIAIGADVVRPSRCVVLVLATVFIFVDKQFYCVIFPVSLQCGTGIVVEAFVGNIKQQVEIIFIPQCFVSTGVILSAWIGLRT